MDSVSQPSVREQVIEAMLDRIAAITTVNGFNTDLGKAVVVGLKIQLGPDDPDAALEVMLGDDQRATWQAGKLFYRLPITFTAIAKAGPEAWRTTEQVLQDVKRAIELADTRLDGLLDHPGLERLPARVREREAGATDVGIELTYLAPIQETWGNP